MTPATSTISSNALSQPIGDFPEGEVLKMPESRAKITTFISCSGEPGAGGGYDGHPARIHYSFGFGPGGGSDIDIDIPISKGDTTQQVAKKLEEELNARMSEDQYRVEESGQESTKKGRLGGPGGVAGGGGRGPGQTGDTGTRWTDDFALIVDGATHVDAGSTGQGKVSFSGESWNNSGGGIVIRDPPRPRGADPLWPNPYRRGRLKVFDPENRVPERMTILPLYNRDLLKFVPPPPPVLPPQLPMSPVTELIPEDVQARRTTGGGSGLLVLSEFGESMSRARLGELMIVPFGYRHTSPLAQMEELAGQLAIAGVVFSVEAGILVPVWMPNGRGRVRMFGFVEGMGSMVSDPGFPWRWVMLPKAKAQESRPITPARIDTVTGPNLPSMGSADQDIPMVRMQNNAVDRAETRAVIGD